MVIPCWRRKWAVANPVDASSLGLGAVPLRGAVSVVWEPMHTTVVAVVPGPRLGEGVRFAPESGGKKGCRGHEVAG
jgi:hypothetical protein